jgi:hypothetical protein
MYSLAKIDRRQVTSVKKYAEMWKKAGKATYEVLSQH